MANISVVVPAFNEEGYISTCLKSVCNQKTSLDFELIVVDTNSKDRTYKIAKKYADKVLINRRRGIWRARNAGAQAARAPLLVFVDADTTIPTNYLSIASAVMQDKSISGLSFAFRFKESSTSLNVIHELSNNYLLWKGLQGKGELLGFNCVMRKKDFQKVGGFPAKPMEDGAMARKLQKIGHVVFMPFPEVETSSRRMKKAGTLKTIEYYASLSLQTSWPHLPLNRIFRYKKYFPIR